MQLPSDSTKRWLVRGFRLIVVSLLLWGLWATVSKTILDLSKNPPHIDPKWLVASAFFYLLGQLPQAMFWQRVLVAAHQRVSFWAAPYAFFVSQPGKYAPGKALVIVLRAGLLKGPGVETTVVAASVFVETLTTMACGAGFAAAILLAIHFWPESTHPINPLFIAGAIGGALVIGLPTIPLIFKQLIKLVGVGKINATAADKLGGVPGRVYLFGWVAISIGWLIEGLSLWSVFRSMGEVNTGLSQWPLLAATVSLSVAAGFLSLIPGGLFGREYLHIELLKPIFGLSAATISALVLRLVWVVSDVAFSVILYGIARWRAGKPLAEPSPPRDDL